MELEDLSAFQIAVQNIIRDFELIDARGFRMGIRRAFDAFSYENERPAAPTQKDRQREHDRTIGAFRKALSCLGETENITSWKIQEYLSHQLRLRMLDIVEPRSEELTIRAILSDDIVEMLSAALTHADDDFEAWKERRKSSADVTRSLPRYPELRITFSSLQTLWKRHRPKTQKPQNFAYYVHFKTRKPGNEATKFVIACFGAIAPRIPENIVLSQFKHFSDRQSFGKH